MRRWSAGERRPTLHAWARQALRTCGLHFVGGKGDCEGRRSGRGSSAIVRHAIRLPPLPASRVCGNETRIGSDPGKGGGSGGDVWNGGRKGGWCLCVH